MEPTKHRPAGHFSPRRREAVSNPPALLRRVHEHLIDRGVAAILQAVIVGIGHALNHGREQNVVGRIKDYRAVEAVAKPRSQDVLPDTEFSAQKVWRHMIRRQELDRGGSQYAFALRAPRALRLSFTATPRTARRLAMPRKVSDIASPP